MMSDPRTDIAALIAKLSNLGDQGKVKEFSACFSKHGKYTLQNGDSATGPHAIEHMLKKFALGMAALGASAPKYMRHNATTSNVELLSETEAEGDTYFLNVNDQGLDHWGRWRDSFVFDDSRAWRFASREVVVEGTASTSWLRKQG